ncbi:MAG: TraB/GumN family protein [Muribaculaceae bacterium]|nr:TraB/GumN family protein [Muribaculaceae bacterium]
MRRFVFTLVAALVCAFASQAQLLWKISGNGAAKPSYIFGTHHIAPVSVLDSVAAFKDALAEVNHVYGEVVMADLMTPAGQQKLMAAMMAPADSTLAKVLTPAQADSVNTVLPMLAPGATVQMFDAFKPAMLNTALTAALSQKAFPDFNPGQQLDATVQQLATEAGKEVGGLETVESQIQVLAGAPIADQVKDLMKVIADMDGNTEDAVRLAALYRKGDLQGMLQMMDEETDSAVDLDRLLFSRNRAWIKRMAEQLPSGAYMYVVGAGHLPGEQGVIELLRKAGYTVTPM